MNFPCHQPDPDRRFEDCQQDTGEIISYQTEGEPVNRLRGELVGRAQTRPELEHAEPDEYETDADAQKRQSVLCKPMGYPTVDHLERCWVHAVNGIAVGGVVALGSRKWAVSSCVAGTKRGTDHPFGCDNERRN